MKFIDLLSSAGQAAGARPCPGGFVVDAPWGEYRLGRVALGEGWYECSVEGRGLVVILRDPVRFTVIELAAGGGQPVYVRLSGGDYDLSVMPGARPGLHPTAKAVLRPLTAVRRARLLAGRLMQALSDGRSLGQIAAMVRLALSRRTYGMRGAGQVMAAGLGVLSAADRQRDVADPVLGDFERRLERLAGGARFLVRTPAGHAPGADRLGDQVYRNFTVDPEDTYDFVVVVGEGDRLTADALLLFAEQFQDSPATEVIVADTWINGQPTARVAWDPLLYWRGLPTPHAHARHVAPAATFSNQSACSIIALPLAFSTIADAFADYPAAAPADKPPCSIIIPTRDRADLLAACLEGLFERTTWPHEVIVVDNGSVEAETFALFEQYSACGLKVVRADMPFNFSNLCNMGVEVAASGYLVFLNNDVVLHRADWLERLMAFAVLPQAGAVGARLSYADGRLQHGGVMLGLTQLCGHLWRGMARADQDDESRLAHSSLRSAVTAACLCVSRGKFEAVGGFDAQHFPVTLNDVDLCLKIEAAGWFNIYCAGAEADHLEGESRGEDMAPEKYARRLGELQAFAAKWQSVSDPWLSQAVTRATEKFAFR